MKPITERPSPLNAYVSGSSRGLAYEIALQLAAGGANIALSSRSDSHLGSASSAIRKVAPQARVVTIRGDLAKVEDQERILDTLEGENFRPDVFVCSCGRPENSRLATLQRSQWEHDLEMILGQAVFSAKKFAPMMAGSGYGRFVFISSIYAKTPNADWISSSIARAGLFALSKAIVSEYAEHGVVSFPLCLGYIDTPLVRNMALGRAFDAPEPISAIPPAWSAQYEEWASAIPAKRIATMREVAELVEFLVSPAAAYLNGTVLSYSGGLDQALV